MKEKLKIGSREYCDVLIIGAGGAGLVFEKIGHPEADAADREGHRGHAEGAKNIRGGLNENDVVAPGNSPGLTCRRQVRLAARGFLHEEAAGAQD